MNVVASTVAETSRSRQGGYDKSKLIPGAVVVVLLLFGSRWAAYLGFPQNGLFLSDVLIAGTMMRLVTSSHPRATKRMTTLVVCWLLISFLILRLTMSLVVQGDHLVELRDAAPYFYIILLPAAFSQYARSTAATRFKTARYLRGALKAHAGWVSVAVLLPSTVIGPHLTPDTFVFQLRPDVDSGLLGVLMTLVAFRVTSRRAPKRELLWVGLALTGIALTPTRAGLLAALASLAVGAIALLSSRREFLRAARKATLGLAPVLLLLAAFLVPLTPPGQKILTNVGISTSNDGYAATARGTNNARIIAWERVLGYVNESPRRQLVGVGFGPDFLTDSGASDVLEGTTFVRVRSPHNYLVGSYARLGSIGVLMLLILVGQLLSACFGRSRRHLADDELVLTCALVSISFLIASMFGVVLESPFGAIPFFWCLGITLSAKVGLRPPDPEVNANRYISSTRQ